MREDSLDLWALQLHASLVGYSSELCCWNLSLFPLSRVCVCGGGCTHYKVYMASKDDFWELALSFHHMGPGVELQVVSTGHKWTNAFTH